MVIDGTDRLMEGAVVRVRKPESWKIRRVSIRARAGAAAGGGGKKGGGKKGGGKSKTGRSGGAGQ